MKKSFCVLLMAVVSAVAADLKQGKFTQVVNQVRVVAAAVQGTRPAKLGDLFESPDLLHTGAASRAELTAPDNTITRIGANSVFAYDADRRGLRLDQGSVLFHSPAGRGGGTIRTGGASASVLGTTLIVSATRDGGFKAIVLEGGGKVTLPSGDSRRLRAGQLAFVLGGVGRFGPILDINLATLVSGSGLVNGFERRLPSLDRIQREIQQQGRKLAKGQAEDTGVRVGDYATDFEVGTVDKSEQERVFEFEGKVIAQARIDQLKRSLETDVVIGDRRLASDRLFLDKFDLVIGGLHFDDFHGFFGRGIEVRTPAVDLAPYEGLGLPFFDFLALNHLRIQQPLLFEADTPLPLFLTAVGQLSLAPAAQVRYDNAGGLHLVSQDSTALLNDSLANDRGLVWLQSGLGDLSLSGCALEGTELKLFAGNNLVASDSSLTAGTALTIGNVAEEIPFDAGKGEDHSSGIAVPPVSNGDITLQRVGIIGRLPTALAVAMYAANVLSLQSVTLNNIASVSLEARTLNLENVAFAAGTAVTLKSELGLLAPNPNAGAPSVPGHVNFISAVSYGGAPAQQAIGAGITITALTGRPPGP